MRALIVRRWSGRRDEALLGDLCVRAAAGRVVEGDQGGLPAVASLGEGGKCRRAPHKLRRRRPTRTLSISDRTPCTVTPQSMRRTATNSCGVRAGAACSPCRCPQEEAAAGVAGRGRLLFVSWLHCQAARYCLSPFSFATLHWLVTCVTVCTLLHEGSVCLPEEPGRLATPALIPPPWRCSPQHVE